jgi:hypothetical protein
MITRMNLLRRESPGNMVRTSKACIQPKLTEQDGAA